MRDRIRAIRAGQPMPPLPCPLTAGGVTVITDPDPDIDLGYRLEQADFDGWEEAEPEE